MNENGLTLSEESVFRRVPKFLAPHQALLFEAFAYSSDSLDIAYSSIFKLANFVENDSDKLDRVVSVQFITNAWSMVDALHNVRHILQALDVRSPESLVFLALCEPASHLRNCMDHLKDQAKNLAMKKKVEPPLLGAVSYNYVPSDALEFSSEGRIVEISKGTAITISIGRLPKKVKTGLLNPADQQPVHGNMAGLRLEAFAYSIELMEAYRAFKVFAGKLEKIYLAAMTEQANRLVGEHNVAYKDLMGHFGSGLSVFAEWSTCPTPEEAT
ncbi:hypothetical protein ACWCPQ_28915 [Nocardia sp. NPDC001965]